jgi:hypothetical protein
MGIASMGGSAAFRMMTMLSSKFRKACSNSFDGETLVATEAGLRAIDEIKIGDRVWAYNENAKEKGLQEVVHLIRGEGVKALIDLQLTSGETITATSEHPFYVPDQDKWVDAGKLTVNDVLQNLQGGLTGVANTKESTELATVFNLTVANDHTYYVGHTKVLVHNAGGCQFPEINWDHILKGRFKKSAFRGLHYLEGGVLPADRYIMSKRQGADGFYSATVFARNGVNRWKRKASSGDNPLGRSTFFPDHWSPIKVQSVINGALIKTAGKTGTVRLSDILQGASDMVSIRVVVFGNKVESAFPVGRNF